MPSSSCWFSSAVGSPCSCGASSSVAGVQPWADAVLPPGLLGARRFWSPSGGRGHAGASTLSKFLSPGVGMGTEWGGQEGTGTATVPTHHFSVSLPGSPWLFSLAPLLALGPELSLPQAAHRRPLDLFAFLCGLSPGHGGGPRSSAGPRGQGLAAALLS